MVAMRERYVFGEVQAPDGEWMREGKWFADRNALTITGMHAPPMAGIWGPESIGACSIVVSGGYEDDEDYGDEIIYTGQGGQDPKTKRQVRDQTFTRGNRALVVSKNEGLPVRVIRGANKHSRFAPSKGYRYDGLYRVEDSWAARGKAGFLMCLFRLVRLAPNQTSGDIISPTLPTGNASPGKRATLTQRTIRNTDVGIAVKKLYDYSCQVCGIRLESASGPYAEAAHIRGLGRPHNGPDVPENVLCLCPNHHALFDLGAFYINDDLSLGGRHTGQIKVHSRHRLDSAHIQYHRVRYESQGRPTPTLSPSDDDDETA